MSFINDSTSLSLAFLFAPFMIQVNFEMKSKFLCLVSRSGLDCIFMKFRFLKYFEGIAIFFNLSFIISLGQHAHIRDLIDILIFQEMHLHLIFVKQDYLSFGVEKKDF